MTAFGFRVRLRAQVLQTLRANTWRTSNNLLNQIATSGGNAETRRTKCQRTRWNCTALVTLWNDPGLIDDVACAQPCSRQPSRAQGAHFGDEVISGGKLGPVVLASGWNMAAVDHSQPVFPQHLRSHRILPARSFRIDEAQAANCDTSRSCLSVLST